MTRMAVRAIAAALFFLFSLSPLAGAEELHFRLDGEWRVSWRNLPAYSRLDFNDRNWARIRIPSNLFLSGAKAGEYFWLRRKIEFTPPENRNLAFFCGPVFDEIDVFINGVHINQRVATPALGYGRYRILSIPSTAFGTRDEHIIALRVRGSFHEKIGIVSGPLEIADTAAATRFFYLQEVTNLISGSMLIVVGLFFFLLYYRGRDFSEYLFFALFAVLTGLIFLLQSEYRFSIAEWFDRFKLAEHLLFILLAPISLSFLVKMARITPPRLLKWQFLAVIVPVAVLALLYGRPHFGYRIVMIWYLLYTPPLIFLIQKIVRSILRTHQIEIRLFAIALIVLPGALILHIFQEAGISLPFPGTGWGILLFSLLTMIALLQRLFSLQMEKERGRRRLLGLDTLRNRMLSNLSEYAAPAATEIIDRMRTDGAELPASEEMRDSLRELEAAVDDIMGLTRLTMLESPGEEEAVPFRALVADILSENGPTTLFRIDDDIIVSINRAYLEILLRRLPSFTEFSEFRHIDLIITQDLQRQPHCRYLLFHDNPRVARQLFAQLSETGKDGRNLSRLHRDLIEEVVRLLQGKLEIRLQNRRFIRIDIRLPARTPETVMTTKTDSEKIRVLHVQDTLQQESAAEIGEDALTAVAEPLGAGETLRFSRNMTVSDLWRYLRKIISGRIR